MTIIIDTETKRTYQIEPSREGENKILCPKCTPGRSKKGDKALQWNQGKGVGHCHHCQSNFVMRDPNFRRQRLERQYTVPEWKNNTQLSDKAAKWFEGRMISQKTLSSMKIYSDRAWMPQLAGEAEAVCFPYFRKGQLVNIKHRGPGKSFTMVAGAELILWNIDCAEGATQLIITEGEMDALSFVECGMPGVVSVPNGASGSSLPYLDNCVDALAHIETFYIAVDHDEAGAKLRNELIRRLGPERCRIVTFDGHKDANEMLCAGKGEQLREMLEQSEYPPMEGMFDMGAHYDDLRDAFSGTVEQAVGVGLEPLDKLVRWKSGQLAIWTGIPSHGKSEMLNHMAVRWNLQNGWKTLFFSPENMPYARYMFPKLAAVLLGRELRSSNFGLSDLDATVEYVSDNFLFIDAGDDYTAQTVLDIAQEAVRRYGIKVLVIDPYNCFEHRRDKGQSETEYIGSFLDSLTRFARKHDVLVNLVAHPRKMERETLGGKTFARPTLYDINGSANFYNKADIGVTVYRRFPDHPLGPAAEAIVTKVRFRDQGETGVAELTYDTRNGRYCNPSRNRPADDTPWIQLPAPNTTEK